MVIVNVIDFVVCPLLILMATAVLGGLDILVRVSALGLLARCAGWLDDACFFWPAPWFSSLLGVFKNSYSQYSKSHKQLQQIATDVGQHCPLMAPVVGRYFGRRGYRLDKYGATPESAPPPTRTRTPTPSRSQITPPSISRPKQ